jgi:hypothetical protein
MRLKVHEPHARRLPDADAGAVPDRTGQGQRMQRECGGRPVARYIDVEPATLCFDVHVPAFLAATVAVSRAVVFRAAAFRSAAAVIAARISR